MDNNFKITDIEFKRLSTAFQNAKAEAEVFAEKYNSQLPIEKCPGCGEPDHCPGLACPDCGHVHSVSWAIIKDTEWGYDVVALNNKKLRVAEFRVDL